MHYTTLRFPVWPVRFPHLVRIRDISAVVFTLLRRKVCAREPAKVLGMAGPFLVERQSRQGGIEMKTIAVRMSVAIIALAICLTPVAWAVNERTDGHMAADAGIGAASFVFSLPYGAAKVAVALLGGLAGG